MNRLVIFSLLALFITGCTQPTSNQPEMPAPQASTPTEAPAPIEAPAKKQDQCDHVAELFDMLVQKKAEGWLEKDALDDMSARGEYSLGYVVDGVFGDRFGPGGSAAARVDTLAACRRMAKGGELY